MPYAVIRVAPERRHELDEHGHIAIRTQYVGLAERLRGCSVVLYQSARQSTRSQVSTGYFASAVIENVIYQAEGTAEIVVRELKMLSRPKLLLLNEAPLEPELFTASMQLKGWSAADDVREISFQQYRDITEEESQEPFVGSPEMVVQMPRFQNHLRPVRDWEFRKLIYDAYEGRCAISGAMLLYESGLCGLIAAHIYPHAKEIHHRASAGILLDPTRHSRYDGGGLIIDDDYSWTPTPEDSLTLTVRHRFLRLPENEADWPDKKLLARQRALSRRKKTD